MYKEIYRWLLFYFCRILFKHLPLRVGITIIIHSRINDPVQCWYRRLFCDIIFYHLLWTAPNPSTWGIYNVSQMFYLLGFPWNCVRSVCQGVDERTNCCQKYKIGSLSIVFAWQVCTVLFGASGWRLIYGPISSTIIILFQMPPLLMMWCYIMLCQIIMK